MTGLWSSIVMDKTVEQYDWVRLKDGQLATVVEVLSETDFIVDTGTCPDDWDTIFLTIDDIGEVYGPEYASCHNLDDERMGNGALILPTTNDGRV